MRLNRLESRFFDEIINAELNVPMHATVTYQGTPLEMIVVPKIAPEGYFRFEYFNAPAYETKPRLVPDGTSYSDLTTVIFATHPLLEDAWQKRAPVKLELKSSEITIPPTANPTLDARVLYADHGNRGILVLRSGQTTKLSGPLCRAEFSIAGFADFRTPEKEWSSIAGIVSDESQSLQNTANRLGDGAQITLSPAPHNIVMDTGDGWQITLTKDEPVEDGVEHETPRYFQ